MADDLRPFLRRMIELQRRNPRLGLLQYENLLTAGRYADLFRLVLRRWDRSARILDWGCGNGHFSLFLAEHGFRPHVFSLDEPPPALEALGAGRCEFRRGDKREPTALPYPDGFFDAVVSVGVLEHVREFGGSEIASLTEIRRILKPGGAFVGSHIPNRWSWVESLSLAFPGKHHHRWRFTRRSIRRLFAQAGFAAVEARSTGFLPRWLMSRCPASLADAGLLAAAYESLDDALELIFPWFCTNLLCLGVRDGIPASTNPSTP